jgi:hypothetical protein
MSQQDPIYFKPPPRRTHDSVHSLSTSASFSHHGSSDLEEEIAKLRSTLSEHEHILADLRAKCHTCTCKTSQINASWYFSLRGHPWLTVLLALTLTALLKCLISLEIVHQRLDSLGAEQIRLAPRPWVPFLWLGHGVLWVWRLLWGHFAAVVEKILAAIVTGLVVTAGFVAWTRTQPHKPTEEEHTDER